MLRDMRLLCKLTDVCVKQTAADCNRMQQTAAYVKMAEDYREDGRRLHAQQYQPATPAYSSVDVADWNRLQ